MQLQYDCTNASAIQMHQLKAIINCMIPITYRTFRSKFTKKEWDQLNKQFCYANSKHYGLTMKNDWAIRYYKACINKEVYYILQWSAIEFIYLKG